MTEAKTSPMPEDNSFEDNSSVKPITNVFKPVISGLPNMQEILREQVTEARFRMRTEQEELGSA